jgi:hypothetical protein
MDVEGHVLGARGGDYTVKEKFDSLEIVAFGGDFAGRV